MPFSSSLFGITCLVLVTGSGSTRARKLYCTSFKKYVASSMWGSPPCVTLQYTRVPHTKEERYEVTRYAMSLLYLFEKNITAYPNLYVSEFLETHRRDYYEKLNSVSEN